MLYLDGKYLIYDETTGATASDLTSKFIFDKCHLRLYPGGKFIVPEIIKMPLAAKKVIPSFFTLNPAPGDTRIINLLKSKLPDVSEETINKLVEVLIAVKQRNPIQKNLTALAQGDPDVLAELDARSTIMGFIPDGQNLTVSQSSPDGFIYLQIPSDQQVNFYVDDYTDAPIPVLDSVFEPYPSTLYRLNKIETILEASPQQRPNVIKKLIDGFNKIEKGAFPKDVNEYIKSFKEIPLEHVFGDSINTNLKIQPNEQKYYNDLIAFIRYHINAQNKQLHRDFTADQLAEQTESDFKNGILPTGLRLYLEKLLSYIVTSQYYHTGFFSNVYDMFDGDDKDDTEESNTRKDKDEEVVAKRLFYRDVQDTRVIQSDADVSLLDYLQISAKTAGASIYAEAILKLLRWGPRKHNMLVVGEENPNSFSLTSMKTITSTIDFSKLSPIEDDGRTFQIDGYVSISVERDGLSEETVAALMMNRLYKNPHNDSDMYVWYVISVEDFVKEYSTVKDIIGVDFVNGKFKVEDNYEQLTKYTMSDAMTHRYLQTNNTVDTLINLGIRDAQSPAYAIINRDQLLIDDLDVTKDLNSIMLNVPESERLHMLYAYWYISFRDKAPIIDTADLQTILDAYTSNTSEVKTVKDDVSDFAYNTMFQENKTEKDVPDMKAAVYNGDCSKLKFSPISSNKKNVFAMAVTPDNIRVYADLKEVTIDPTVEPLKPLQHTVYMLCILSGLYSDSPSEKMKFATVNSFTAIMKAVQTSAE